MSMHYRYFTIEQRETLSRVIQGMMTRDGKAGDPGPALESSAVRSAWRTEP